MSRHKPKYQRRRPCDVAKARVQLAEQRILFTSRRRRKKTPHSRRGKAIYRGCWRNVRLLPTGLVVVIVDGQVRYIVPHWLARLPT